MHGLHPVRPRAPSDPIVPKVRSAAEEAALRAWACALALVVFAFPVFSPDLFWHLSAGRWIRANLAVPAADPFTFTAAGAPWIDFEWGLQLAWWALHELGGLRLLWALKAALLAACFLPVDGLLRDKGARGAARAGALALWLAAFLAQADLRADLVSAALFAVLLRRLESGRASFLFGFALFAAWANLHAGFVLGLGLYAAYAALARPVPAGLGGEAAGALLGSLLNPYGPRLYGVLLAHASDPDMARFVMEWGPPSPRAPFQAPLLAALAVAAAAAWAARRRAPRALLAVAAGAGAASLAGARFGAYFASAGAALVFSAFPRPSRGAVAAGLAALTALLWVPVRRAGLGPAFRDVYVARRAADFVAREREALGGLRLFNQYEWGGYLGWRLGPGSRVYGDGRYLFHGQLPELQAALSSPDALAALAGRRRLDGFLIRNYPARSRAGASSRPWHELFFPRERWALVYADEQALLFVDRAKAPAGWVAAREALSAGPAR